MSQPPLCPIVMLAAPASRQGKTLITASLARLYRRQGHRVRVFKLGPDFLDPKILEQASGQLVDNLDSWMMGEEYCRKQLLNARKNNDIVLIESLMGLFDHEPSNAEFAKLFGIPILLIIDARSMGASFAAIAYGMTHFDSSLVFLGVVANCVGSENHHQLIQQNFPNSINFLGAIPRDKRLQLPERHLGLYQAEELENIDGYLDAAADVLEESGVEIPACSKTETTSSATPQKDSPQNISISVAKDAAFSFIYHSNISQLRSLGCDIIFFSPLHDKQLPNCDAIWLPGGYPELYAEKLSSNTTMRISIAEHVEKNKAVYAECGGMLYLFEALKTKQGESYPMCGLLAGTAIMEKKFQGIGLQELSVFDDVIRGHSFHHARIETTLQPMQSSQYQRQNKQGEAFFSDKSIYASFLHLWFASSGKVTRELFRIE